MNALVRVGDQYRYLMRLLLYRVPDDVAERRRAALRADAARRHQAVSAKALELAAWTLLLTDVPTHQLTRPVALVLLRERWQIERLFKLWKQEGHLDEWRTSSPFGDLSKPEQEELLALCQASAQAAIMYPLVQDFFRLVRARQGTQLDSWLSKVEASGIQELQRFGNGLERDKAVVMAGLTLVHSNGQVEGQVTRIKLIKRMMFGRAGFALLRQRILHTL